MNAENQIKHHRARIATAVRLLDAVHESSETKPVPLRIDVNCVADEVGGLGRLLIRKGIVTAEEVLDTIAGSMKDDADTYERRCRAKFGDDKSLGETDLFPRN